MTVFEGGKSRKTFCHPHSFRISHRKERAGSRMPILIPEGPRNGVQEGYLGSETPKIIPRGLRKGRAGSGMPILIPEGPRNGVQEGYLGSETPKMIPQGLRKGRAGVKLEFYPQEGPVLWTNQEGHR